MNLQGKIKLVKAIIIVVLAVHVIAIFHHIQFYPGFFLPKFENRNFSDSIKVTRLTFKYYKNNQEHDLAWKQVLKPYDKRYFRFIIEHWENSQEIRLPIKKVIEKNYETVDSVFFCLDISYWNRNGQMTRNWERKCQRF